MFPASCITTTGVTARDSVVRRDVPFAVHSTPVTEYPLGNMGMQTNSADPPGKDTNSPSGDRNTAVIVQFKIIIMGGENF